MKKIAIFGANAQYKIGGAETSMKIMADDLCEIFDITVISGKRNKNNSYSKIYYKNLKCIPLISTTYFKYTGNFINYFIIYNFFRKNKFDVVIGNGSTCIAAINATVLGGGKAVYYIRDEFSLNQRFEYVEKKSILQKALRIIKRVLEYPFYKYHCMKNSNAIRQCHLVIANSKYISGLLQQQEGVDPKVIYPFAETNQTKPTDLNNAQYITMVGNASVKGIETFLSIAKLMPDSKFRVVGQKFQIKQIDNVLYHPFFDNISEMFESTKLLLVPSIWQEAFGKVSIEASSHSIPVIVSDRGGLPETVCDPKLIVKDYLNPTSWVHRIQLIEKDLHHWGVRCKQHSLKFDVENEKQKLRSAIEALIYGG